MLPSPHHISGRWRQQAGRFLTQQNISARCYRAIGLLLIISPPPHPWTMYGTEGCHSQSFVTSLVAFLRPYRRRDHHFLRGYPSHMKVRTIRRCHGKSSTFVLRCFKIPSVGPAGGIRTHYLPLCRLTLYQMSYPGGREDASLSFAPSISTGKAIFLASFYWRGWWLNRQLTFLAESLSFKTDMPLVAQGTCLGKSVNEMTPQRVKF